MSGIVALAQTDGGSVDGSLLDRLTASLVFRGPDGLGTQALGPIGMGHAQLATTPEAAHERQPATLDGRVWITADARIDGRVELVAELGGVQAADLDRATDVELVLHAYRAWGRACAEHLLGDFAFVIWDAPRRRLFAARDHFGVKLLYYAVGSGSLVLSNTLSCVRAHPSVSDRLDASAVGNFLLWGENWDRSTTTFADVHCLPPAHTLLWEEGRGAVETRRYWDVPEEGPRLRYSDRRDYVDQFRGLLAAAVEDRLRTRSAAVFMSGGLDSPMVAAVARERMAEIGPRYRLEALTVCHDHLPADQECYLAKLAARHIGIPVHHLVEDDDLTADDASGSRSWMLEVEAPEPALLGSIGPDVLGYREAAAIGRVILTGWDGDALLGANVGALWRARLLSGELRSLAGEVGWHLRARKLPRVGFRAALSRIRSGRPKRVFGEYPSWIDPGFENSLDLRGRWLAVDEAPDPGRTVRGRARDFLSTPVWRSVLDPADPGMSGMPLEQRHPLLDLRLVRFSLSLPPIPWCVEKELFRVAMRGDLPDQVLRRPKTPFAGDPLVAGLGEVQGPVAHDITPELADYVDVKKYVEVFASLRVAAPRSGPLAYAAYNTFALNGWLRSRSRRVGSAS